MTSAIQLAPKARAILIPESQQRLAALFSAVAKRVQVNGSSFYAIKFNEENVQILRRAQVHVDAPISHFYNWPTSQPPLDAQKVSAEALCLHKRLYNLSAMGVGKTRASAYSLDYLVSIGKVKKALVVAPLSTLNVVWYRELFTEFERLRPVVLYGTREKRLRLLRDEQFNVHIINHDAVHLISEIAHKEALYDMVIIDELSAFRTKRTRRWKHMNLIINGDRKHPRKVPYVLGLTGTPTPNAPTDAWAQCQLITPHTVPKSFVRFRDMTMLQVSQFRWVEKKEATRIVAEAMQPSVRFTRDECFDLPPVTHSDREAELSKEQKAAYKQLMDEYVVEFESGRITAVNEGVKLNKLLQVCGGCVYMDGGKGQVVDLAPNAKLDALDEVLTEAQHKTIVFAPFRHIVDRVFDEMEQRGHAVAKIYGSTSHEERSEIFHSFQDGDAIRVLIAHPGTMSHGLTLTAADTIVWYLPTTSSETYLQANARITRGGQTKHQHIIHLISGKVEEHVYKRLKQKHKTQGVLLDLLAANT